MVVGAFPIAKLSVLLVKQISKPIANMCKERAKNSPFFRTYVCMPPAQFYNWCEVKAKMWILNLGKPVNIPVLSQEMAIELGANLLGESVIFIIGAGLLVIEYNRQSKKETAKETQKLEEMQQIQSTISDLYFAVQKQETQLREMERLIYSLSGVKPPTPSPAPPAAPTVPLPSEEGPKNPPIMRNVENIYQTRSYASNTPYPDRGIILRSLNYIQMDVFSSTIFNSNDVKREVEIEKQGVRIERDTAVLTGALHHIENNCSSMF